METADVRGLLALLLPNGNLAHYPAPAGGFIQLTITAGATDSIYLEEKVEEFKRFIPTRAKIVPYRTRARPGKRGTEVLRFRVSSNRLRPIYNLLYPEGYREVTQTVLGMLGARAAAWLWAEGARMDREGGACLGHVGQTFEEGARFARWLFVLTGAEAILDDELVRPRLIFTPDEAVKIRKALLPYAPETRTHLFQESFVDNLEIRRQRTELRARLRRALQEEEGDDLAFYPEAGIPDAVPEEPARDPAEELPHAAEVFA